MKAEKEKTNPGGLLLTFPLDSGTFKVSARPRPPLEPDLQRRFPMFLLGPIGPTELLLILLIVIILFGARKLPDLGKSLGEGIKNFKKSMSPQDKSNKDESAKKNEPPADKE